MKRSASMKVKQRFAVAARPAAAAELDNGRLHEHRNALERALYETRDAREKGTLVQAIDQRLEQIRSLPVTPPAPGPAGWVAVRVVGERSCEEAVLPLPGVILRLRESDVTGAGAGGAGGVRETSTGPEGVAFLELGADETSYVVDAVAPDGEVAGTIKGRSTGSLVHLLQVPYQAALGPSFAAGSAWQSALAVAEQAAVTLKQRAAAELETQEQELVSRLAQIDRVL